MVLWISIALASDPVWVGNEGTVGALPWADAVVETPTGSVMLHEDLTQRVVADTVVVESFPRDRAMAINAFRPCDVNGDGVGDRVLATDQGGEVRDSFTDALLMALPWSTPLVLAECADIDADGVVELVTLGQELPRRAQVVVFDLQGQVVRSLDVTVQPDRASFEIGQLDGDPALELLLLGGDVIDGGSVRSGLPAAVEHTLLDIDGDGIDEVLARNGSAWTLYDAGQPLWQVSGLGRGALAEDLDGDGRSEVLFHDTPQTVSPRLTMVDPMTGTVIHQEPYWLCERLFSVDDDGSGARRVACDRAPHLRYDVSTRRAVHLNGQGQASLAAAGDLDGDGNAEVVWSSLILGDRLVIRDGDGVLLDTMYLGPRHSALTTLLDVDGDGDLEILRGLEAWDWSPATGFVPHPWLRPGSGLFRPILYDDIDQDGIPELIVWNMEQTAIIEIDLQTGGQTTLVPAVFDVPTLLDVDGDGRVEVMYLTITTQSELVLVDLRGRELWRGVGHNRHEVLPDPAGDRWATCVGDVCEAYRWTASGVRVDGRLTLDHPLGMVGRELKLLPGHIAVAGNPVRLHDFRGNTVYARWMMSTGDMAVVGDTLWFGDATGLTAWRMP